MQNRSNAKEVVFEPKTTETASEPAKSVLEKTKSTLGFVPNMYSYMSINPSLMDAYAHAYASFRANAGFSPVEQEVILLSVSYENECDYCMAAHSFVADKMSKVPEEVTNAIREGKSISDPKLNALSRFTKAVTAKRGHMSQDDVIEFLNAGL